MSSFEKSLGEVNGQLKMVIELLNKYSKKSDDNNNKIVEIDNKVKIAEKNVEEIKKKLDKHIEIAIQCEKKELEDTIDELLKDKTKLKKGIASTILTIVSGIWQIGSAVLIVYLLYKMGLQ